MTTTVQVVVLTGAVAVILHVRVNAHGLVLGVARNIVQVAVKVLAKQNAMEVVRLNV